MIAALKDGDPAVRIEAAETLGDIKDRRAVKPLMDILTDRNESVQTEAINALGKIGDKRAIQPLITVYKSGSADIRVAITSALRSFKDETVVEFLILSLVDKEEKVRQAALDSLVRIGTLSVKPLIEILNMDIHWTVKEVIVSILGKIGDERAVKCLSNICMGKSENYQLRLSAAKALKSIKPWEDVRTLVDMADPQAIKYIIFYLNDENIGWEVGESLKQIGKPAATGLIIVLIAHKDASARGTAAEILGDIQDIREINGIEIPLIFASLYDKDEHVRIKAATALAQLGLSGTSQRTREAIERNLAIMRSIVERYLLSEQDFGISGCSRKRSIGPPPPSILESLIDPETREAIARMSLAQSLKELLESLLLMEQDPDIKMTLEELLRQM